MQDRLLLVLHLKLVIELYYWTLLVSIVFTRHFRGYLVADFIWNIFMAIGYF